MENTVNLNTASSEEIQSPKAVRFGAVDILRGILIFAVTLSHAWFVDSDIDRTTHLATPRTGENSAGNFYFYYKNATSITVSFKYLN